MSDKRDAPMVPCGPCSKDPRWPNVRCTHGHYQEIQAERDSFESAYSLEATHALKLEQENAELLQALECMLHASPASGWEQSNARKLATDVIAKVRGQ